MKHIRTFENFLSEGADESVNEGNNNWGTYNSPEGATVAKEINKAYDKLNSDVAKAFNAFKSTVRVYTTGAKKELGDKSGFNDSEGEEAMSFAIKQLIAKTFDIDARNAYHDAFWMYENELSESHYAFLGGNSNFTDDEMRKNVVEGRKPGPKEQKRRQIYQLAGNYLHDNPEYKSFSYDEDTDEFHFYKTDWSVSNSMPDKTVPRQLLASN